jgi:hypothetical protein
MGFELEKYKVDDVVTIDKNHTNDIQEPEEEDKQFYASISTSSDALYIISAIVGSVFALFL